MTTHRYVDFTDEDLSMKAQAGDREAAEALTVRYFDLADVIARAFPIAGIDIEDRHAEALQGVLKAIQGWKPGKGTKFKTFAKMAMRRVLIDLHRERHQKSEIPPSAKRSLDVALSSDGDETTLVDTIAGDDDPAGDVLGRQDAIERRASVAAAQWRVFRAAVEGNTAEASDRLIASVKTFARAQVAASKLTLDVYKDLMTLVDQKAQLGLFGIVAEDVQATDAARAFFEEYCALQWLILVDLAEGYEQAEIAERHETTPTVVAQMLSAIRERVGIMEETQTPPLRVAA